MHTALYTDTEGLPLGIIDQKIWSRTAPIKGRNNKIKNKLPISKKESFKWIESIQKTITRVPREVRLVTVCDREADIYEFIVALNNVKTEFVIRASFDRAINKNSKRSKPEDKL